jgi:type IV secretory pathway VirD2 relaxase
MRQRCAVRVTYSPNRVRGQWGAHGRYIARESATRELESAVAGFSATQEWLDVPKMLDGWQKSGDERLFKLIVSPEFGDRLDLRKHTHGLMTQMEQDLGVKLEWVAVSHFNTGHPHVHIALRGRSDAGPFRLRPDYVKRGLRDRAEALCTAQLGFRTQLDALEAERREIDALRFTSLDHQILKQASPEGVYVEPTGAPASDYQRVRRLHTVARLRTLSTLGLACETQSGVWQMRLDSPPILRSLQLGRDRQKLLALGLSPEHLTSSRER